jgi:hypothetical protein
VLQQDSARFETRPLGTPQHEEFFNAIKKTPHPEVPREARPRRTHNADPDDRQFPDSLFWGDEEWLVISGIFGQTLSGLEVP